MCEPLKSLLLSAQPLQLFQSLINIEFIGRSFTIKVFVTVFFKILNSTFSTGRLFLMFFFLNHISGLLTCNPLIQIKLLSLQSIYLCLKMSF